MKQTRCMHLQGAFCCLWVVCMAALQSRKNKKSLTADILPFPHLQQCLTLYCNSTFCPQSSSPLEKGRIAQVDYSLVCLKFQDESLMSLSLWMKKSRILLLFCFYTMLCTVKRVCTTWYSSYLLLAGRIDHVFCKDSMWMGHGCHFCHSYLPLGSGGLCWRTLLQGSQTDHEEGTMWSEAAGDCLDARYKK